MATNGYIDISEKREVWKQISLEFNGQFKISKIVSTDLEIHRLTIPYKHYQIRISESETKPLKFEIDFNSLLNFKLTDRKSVV